ncbi:tetraspanin-10 [Genypterus blacodes]|uniref:tetraspanin-10 n=1 Tax=Genypterus blacodes TaxID=154954 RepID=UPI003F75B908
MRFLSVRGFPMLWSRRETAQNETSPLIPKAGEDAEQVARVSTELNREGTNNGREQSSYASKRTRQRHGYSLVDYCLKCLLFLTNLLFTVMGLVVLGLAVWGLITKESFAQEKIGSIGTDPMLIILSVTFVLTALCLSGCVGAIRENCCLLKLFCAAVLVLLSAQVVAAIVVYNLKSEIGSYMQSGMLTAMVRYQEDLDLRFITDEIQTNLQCCGAENYRDWEINIYYNCSAPGVLACGVPATCCVDPLENGTVWNSQCGAGAQSLDEFSAQSVIFLGGCLGGISRWVELHSGLIGTVGIVLLGAQILTLFVTTRLIESIQWHKAVV